MWCNFMTEIEHIHSEGNKVLEIINQAKLEGLKILNIFSELINTLPPEIGELENLQELYIQGNMLETLPETFGNLKNLQNLYLGNNELMMLPESFGKLSKLKISSSPP